MRWSFDSREISKVSSVRHHLIEYLKSCCHAASDFQAAALIYGELVANAVQHAGGTINIELTWNEGAAALHVHDDGPHFKIEDFKPPDDPFAENGRGLFIVRSLAEALHVSPISGDGKTVTALLSLRCEPGR